MEPIWRVLASAIAFASPASGEERSYGFVTERTPTIAAAERTQFHAAQTATGQARGAAPLWDWMSVRDVGHDCGARMAGTADSDQIWGWRCKLHRCRGAV